VVDELVEEDDRDEDRVVVVFAEKCDSE